MARGVEVVAPLPKVSFVKIDDDTLSKPAGVADNTARGFGCEYFSVGLPAGFERSHLFVPQITMAPNFRGRSTTFGTVVEMLFAVVFRIRLTRFLEPLERELAVQVEYDMDEQGTFVKGCWGVFILMFRVDMEWLDNMNAERKKEQADRVSYETFEIIMDRLEKDWFDLVRFHRTQSPVFVPELCR